MKKRWMASFLLLALVLTLLPVGALAAAPELPEGCVFILDQNWETDPDIEDVYWFNIVDANGDVTQMMVSAQLRELITADRVDTYADGWTQNTYIGRFMKITDMDSEGVVTALEGAGELADVAYIDRDAITFRGGRFYRCDDKTRFVYVDMVITEGADQTTAQDDTLVFKEAGSYNPLNPIDRNAVSATAQITKEPIHKAIRPYDSIRALVIPDETDSALAKYVYVQRNLWGDPRDDAPWSYTRSKTFTGGFRWVCIHMSAREDYVADAFAADARFYWNGVECAKSDFEQKLEPKISGRYGDIIPGLVVKFYCCGTQEIGAVEAIEYSVAQLAGPVGIRLTSDGSLQVKVPGLVDDWINADKAVGYQDLDEGDVILYYIVDDGAERTYIMEKAQKVTGRVVAVNTQAQIMLNNGLHYGRTGLQTVPTSATLGFDHPAYTSGNDTFLSWPGTMADFDATYDFFLDKNGDVCFIQDASPVAVTGVSLNKTAETLNEGEVTYLKATVLPDSATDRGVYWTSSDTSVVTVNQTGYVTTLKAGTATITVTTVDGGFTATCGITVKAKNVNGGSSSGSGSSGGSGGPSSSGGGSSSGGRPTIGATYTVTPPVTSVTETFTDVVWNGWYVTAVQFVVDKGLFRGVSDSLFSPDGAMTRSMLMTVLARLDGQDTTGGGTWYAKGMEWAKAQGISDGTMAESNVTREQLVTMLYRYAKAQAGTADLKAFSDGADVSDWARDAMTWAVANGILTGKDGQRLDPQGTATRAEVATILQRFVENK